jgi:hypothetical protein
LVTSVLVGSIDAEKNLPLFTTLSKFRRACIIAERKDDDLRVTEQRIASNKLVKSFIFSSTFNDSEDNSANLSITDSFKIGNKF